eukprot:s1157_g17.t1
MCFAPQRRALFRQLNFQKTFPQLKLSKFQLAAYLLPRLPSRSAGTLPKTFPLISSSPFTPFGQACICGISCTTDSGPEDDMQWTFCNFGVLRPGSRQRVSSVEDSKYRLKDLARLLDSWTRDSADMAPHQAGSQLDVQDVNSARSENPGRFDHASPD